MKKKFYYGAALAVLLGSVFTACNNEETAEVMGGKAPLEVKVGVEKTESRALISETVLPDLAEIGVTLKNKDETDYDGKTYSNIRFTAAGTGSNQSWDGASDILLSATSGNAYAYYPYDSSVTEITQIPISTAEQDDYMYATPVTELSSTNPIAAISMNHALSAVRVAIKRGTYTGTGTIYSVSVKGTSAATTATLNAETGTLSNISGSNTEISVNNNFLISTTLGITDIIVVPTGTSGALIISVNLDGKTYSVQTTQLTLEKNNIYIYTLNVDATGLTLGGVSVGDWGYNNSGNPVIDLGYKVTLAGDMTDVALQNKVENETLTIMAVPMTANKEVAKITSSGNANITQTLDKGNGHRTIIVSGLQSDVTVSFAGTHMPINYAGDQTSMTIDETRESDGTVTITATPTGKGVFVNNVTGAGSDNTILTQSVNMVTGVRTITIKEITSPYTVTFNGVSEKVFIEGNQTDMSIDKIIESDGTITITATPTNSEYYYIDEVTGSGSATMSQSLNDETGVRTIVITEQTDLYTIHFNGTRGKVKIKVVADDGSLVDYSAVTGNKTTYKGVAILTGKNKFMIQRDFNNQPCRFSRGVDCYNEPIDIIYGNYYVGYLAGSEEPQLERNYAKWTDGALSDFEGKRKTDNHLNNESYVSEGYLTETLIPYRETNGNEWYVPSLGQLALIYLNLTEVNQALNAIEGIQLDTEGAYWSMTDLPYYAMWVIDFSIGKITIKTKASNTRSSGNTEAEDIGLAVLIKDLE